MVSEKYSFYYFREIDWNSNMINCEKSKNHIKNLIPTNFLYFSHEKGDYFRNFLFIIIILKNNQNFCRTQVCDFDELFWITWKVFMISKYCYKYIRISDLVQWFFSELKNIYFWLSLIRILTLLTWNQTYLIYFYMLNNEFKILMKVK